MSFKDLIFKNPDNNSGNKKKSGTTVKSFKSKFPAQAEETKSSAPVATLTPTPVSAPITPDNPACEPHLEKIMELYEKGFEDLNMDGYDFFEYFKGVMGVGINNPAAYTMALTMAKTMDASVTKESLLSQSKHYITEINKVHAHYATNGNKKSEEAVKAKTQEESALTAELANIDNEMNRLSQLKTTKEGELKNIDAKYSPQITEIHCKMMANDIANERIIGTINQVVEGVNKNL